MSKMNKVLIVKAVWDPEASVWVATSNDVPGLVTEAQTIEEMVEKLKVIIPELLESNGVQGGNEIPFKLLGEFTTVTTRHAA